MSAPDITLLSAAELAEKFRSRELSPVDLVEANLQQIERLDGEVNAWCLVDADSARESARASEARYQARSPAGPLDGVTVAVKDVLLTRGWPTLRGSRTIDPRGPWEADAPAVAALRDAGAVLLGKVATPEFAWKATTDSLLLGITRNPWDISKTPGGSSGGSAVAVVLGMAAIALGSDGAGSIRIPASFCGHPGLKPTFGRVPAWPASPFGTLSHVGPMARTVEDLALMMSIITRPDIRDPTTVPDADVTADFDRGARQLKVAYSADLGFATVDPEVKASVQSAVETFERELGAHVEAVDLNLEDCLALEQALWQAGAAAVLHMLPADMQAQIDPALRQEAAEGERLTAVDLIKVASRRGELTARMAAFHQDYDLLLTPTLPIPAFSAGRNVPNGWPSADWLSWTPFTYPFNLTQQPAGTVPCGLTADGLPIGLQVTAARFADALVLRACRAFEQARPQIARPPLLSPPP